MPVKEKSFFTERWRDKLEKVSTYHINITVPYFLHIQILRTLHNHPFIVSIYDIIRESESTYIIMEYISNSTLLEGIISWPNFNEADVRFVMLQILEAVHFCHQQRIVHRVSWMFNFSHSRNLLCENVCKGVIILVVI